MSAGAHTDTLVRAGAGNFIRPIGGGIIAEARGTREYEENTANAYRLAACWNCLQGLNTQQVERLGKLLAACDVDTLLTESGV